MRNFIKLNQPDTANGSKRVAYFEDVDFKGVIEIEQNGKIYSNVIFTDGRTIMATDKATDIINQVKGTSPAKPTEPKQNGQKQQKII